MFYHYFKLFCNELGEPVSSVIQYTGLSERNVDNWKNGSIPRKSTIEEIVKKYTDEDVIKKYKPRTNLRELTVRALEIGPLAHKLKKTIEYGAPDVDNLCRYLNITQQEWERWLEGDIAAYEHIEKLAQYFDVAVSYLGTYGDSGLSSMTHYFTPYPFEDCASVDREIEAEKKKADELLHAAITGDKQVVILKTYEDGLQILTSSSENMELLQGFIKLLKFEEFNIGCKLNKYEQDCVNYKNSLKEITERFLGEVSAVTGEQ